MMYLPLLTSAFSKGFARLVPVRADRNSIALVSALTHLGSLPSSFAQSVVDSAFGSHHVVFVVKHKKLYMVPLVGSYTTVNGNRIIWVGVNNFLACACAVCAGASDTSIFPSRFILIR
jgi:hypothetical protein